jgi:hypothetical protein
MDVSLYLYYSTLDQPVYEDHSGKAPAQKNGKQAPLFSWLHDVMHLKEMRVC